MNTIEKLSDKTTDDFGPITLGKYTNKRKSALTISEKSSKDIDTKKMPVIKNPTKDITQLFKYNDCEIKTIIIDKDNIWFKGKDIATVLEYVNTNQAIKDHVDDEDKTNFSNLRTNYGGHLKIPLENIDPQTIFINESGLYSLILSCQLPNAKQFKHWVTKDVLPSIRKTGSYNISEKQPIKYESVYMNKNITDFDNKNTFYISYIGLYDDKHTYKFGVSKRMFERDYCEHRKVFDIFDLIFLQETINSNDVEHSFKKELKVRNINREITINDKNQTELFTTTDEWDINKIINLATDLINSHPLKKISDLEQKNNQLEHENQIVKLKLEIEELKNKINLLERNQLTPIHKEKIKRFNSLSKIIESYNDLKNQNIGINININELFNQFLNKNIMKIKPQNVDMLNNNIKQSDNMSFSDM